MICRLGFVAGAFVATVAACGKSDAPAVEGDSAATSTTTMDTAAMNAATAPQAGTGNAAPVTVADIDRWQKGMVAELKAVQDAGAKLKAARTQQDTLESMMGSNEMSTLEAGARAAGLNPERYKFVRSTLSSAALAISPLELDMDMTNMPPDFADQLKKQGENNLARMSADIPADVVAALRPRATELRKQSVTLVGERLKASGAVP